jgi:hypothetical protein
LARWFENYPMTKPTTSQKGTLPLSLVIRVITGRKTLMGTWVWRINWERWPSLSGGGHVLFSYLIVRFSDYQLLVE